jgi:rubrerythrin
MQRSVLDPFAPLTAAPPSPVPTPLERLVATFAHHEKREREALREFHDNLKKHDNPLVDFLLRLVVADEEKHHEIIRKVAASLEADLTWDTRLEKLPGLGKLTSDQRDELVRLTDELIAEEKHGIADYKALMKSSEDYYGGLLNLLLETVIHDSKKHLVILEFLRKRLERAR